MSYLRFETVCQYVEDITYDYIYPCKDDTVEDYGKISDSGLVELLAQVIQGGKFNDGILGPYLIKKVAERLEIPLRKSPLSRDEICEKYNKLHKNR